MLSGPGPYQPWWPRGRFPLGDRLAAHRTAEGRPVPPNNNTLIFRLRGDGLRNDEGVRRRLYLPQNP